MDKENTQNSWNLIQEYPFSSSIKRMSSSYLSVDDSKKFLFAKGSPEGILSLCQSTLNSNHQQQYI